MGTDELAFNLPFYCTPETANSSQLIFRSEMHRKGVPKLVLTMLKMTPHWLNHITSPGKILDGDMMFLNRQSTQILNGELTPGSDYFMPAPCDKGTHELWRFMNTHCTNGINYYPHVVEAVPKPAEEVLDRYTQHVKSCKFCKRAHDNIKLGMVVALAVAVAAGVMGFVGGVTALTAQARWGWKPQGACWLVAGVALWTYQKLQWLEKQFGFEPYIHAEKN